MKRASASLFMKAVYFRYLFSVSEDAEKQPYSGSSFAMAIIKHFVANGEQMFFFSASCSLSLRRGRVRWRLLLKVLVWRESWGVRNAVDLGSTAGCPRSGGGGVLCVLPGLWGKSLCLPNAHLQLPRCLWPCIYTMAPTVSSPLGIREGPCPLSQDFLFGEHY